MSEPTRRHDGIDVRHARGCRSRTGGRCNCSPSYRAEAYDRRSEKKVRKTFPTLAAAKAWRSDASGDIRRGVRRGPSGTTLRRAGEDWIAGARDGSIRTRSGEVFKPSTLAGYEAALRARIFPALGAAKLEDVGRADLQRFVDRLLAEGLDPSTIRNALMPVRVIFRRAVARGVLGVNPATGLELPASRGRRDRIADPEEAAALLAAIPSTARPRHLGDGALWRPARGRVAGARMVVDRPRGWHDRRRARLRPEGPRDDRTEVRRRDAPRADRRRAPRPPARPQDRERRRRARLRPGRRTALRHGGPADERAPRLEGRRLAPITLHECRHTFASLMIAAGVNAKALSTYMGHANIAVTLDRYGHLMPGNEDEAAGLLDAYLERADTAARLAQVGK